MKSNPELDALARRAEEAGGRVLRTVLPEAGPIAQPTPAQSGAMVAQCTDSTPVNSRHKPSKYRNVRTLYAGLIYDSKAEADYAAVLDLEAKVCPGMWWVRQVTFHLGLPKNVYRCDFLVYSPESPLPIRAVDVKGTRTAKFNHDVKLWRSYGPLPLIVVTRKRGRWIEEAIPGRSPNP